MLRESGFNFVCRALTGSLTGVLLFLYAGSAVASPVVETVGPNVIPAETVPVALELPRGRLPVLTEHSFTFARSLDYCGSSGSRQEVRLQELPVSAAYPRPSAVITVIVSFPAYEEPHTCPPIPYAFETIRVRTKRPAPSLRFFDGSYEPPRRLWPTANRSSAESAAPATRRRSGPSAD